MHLSAVAGLLIVAAGCVVDDEDESLDRADPPLPEVVRYKALGDSLATGAGADTSYVAEYADWLEAQTGSRVEVNNLAVDGWTSDALLDALRTDEAMQDAVAEAHVLTWDIGGNDLLGALWTLLSGNCGGPDGHACIRQAVTTANDNGDAVLHRLIELRDGDADGLRTTELYLPFVEDPRVAPYIAWLQPHLDEFNAHLRASARARGVEVARVAEAFHEPDGDGDPVARGLMSPDGVHPSGRGHEVIAEHLAELGVEVSRRN